jgi:uncharacterized protein (DUF1330 family)
MYKLFKTNFFKSFILNFGLIVLAFSSMNLYAHNHKPLRLLDFVILNSGYVLEDRDVYEAKVEGIASRYGMKIERKFDITKFMMGNAGLSEVSRINIWFVPEGAMKSLSRDPDYQALVPSRNKIHNMDALSLYIADADSISKQATGTVMVDLVTMNPGFNLSDRKDYESKVAPVTARHGMTRFASYDIINKKMGIAPASAVRLNFWSIEDTKKMKLVSEDPEYKALLAYRNTIHDMKNVTLFFAEPLRLE